MIKKNITTKKYCDKKRNKTYIKPSNKITAIMKSVLIQRVVIKKKINNKMEKN